MRIFYILVSFILLMTVEAQSQSRLTSTPDSEGRFIKYYPNPAVNMITFDFQNEHDKSYSFQIFNFLGKKVYEAPAVDQKTIVNLSDFFRGIYIFQLRDNTGKIIESGKFQVSK